MAGEQKPGEVPLIPREILFGNPDKFDPQISPDGRYLAWVAPSGGVLNLWLRTVGREDDHPLTADTGRGITLFLWARNSGQLLYFQDSDGDENWRLYAVTLETGATRLLTPSDPGVKHKVQVELFGSSPERPDQLLIGLNSRDERFHDVYRLDTRSGELQLLQESGPRVSGWLIDNALAVRGFVQTEPDGGATLMLRNGPEEAFRPWRRVPADDVFGMRPVGFSAGNDVLYLIESTGRNAGALVTVHTRTGAEKVVAGDPQFDVNNVKVHPGRHTLQAVRFLGERNEWRPLEPEIGPALDTLRAANKGDLRIQGETLDDRKWLVRFNNDDQPIGFWLFDREDGSLAFLFHDHAALVDQPLCGMRPVRFLARDGRNLWAYLTLPRWGVAPHPLVLNVHGGPWERDVWGYHPEAQWLANRGYACLQVNFRGSTGYGKDHLNAGKREWARGMQDDLSDAVRWAVEQGHADPRRIGIYGGSYGGYAALAGVTFTPELFACAISMCGPSSILTLLNSMPPYWESFRRQVDLRVGRIPRNADGSLKEEGAWTEADRAEVESLRARSPLYSAGNVRCPVLIAQGANDPRVKKAESDQFVAALRSGGIEAEYLVYDNEGHGFVRPENRLDFYARAEKFLARHLGGRFEPA